MDTLSVSSQLLPITVKIPLHLTETVAAEFFAHRLGQDQGDHRFTNDPGSGNYGYV